MKILIVHNAYRFRGGEERYVTLQTEVLLNEGHEVVFYRKDSRDIERLPAFMKLRVAGEMLYSRRVYREVSELIEVEKPDVVHIHNVLPLITPSAIRASADSGVPVVYSHHNYRISCPSGLRYLNGSACSRCSKGSFIPAVRNRCIQESFWPSLAYAATLQLHKVLGTFVNDVSIHICPTKYLAREVAKVLPAGAMVEVVNHFLPDRPTQPRHGSRPYVAYLGRISQEKGVQVLLRAAPSIVKKTDIEILGDGPLRVPLQESVDSEISASVHFRGHVDDESRFETLEGALAVIVPSLCEEIAGYVVLEGFRAGVPIIASRAGGLAELVEDGVNGILCPPGSSHALATAIERLVQEPQLRDRLSRQARNTYLQKYTAGHGYTALTDCYARAMEMRQSHGQRN